MAAKQFFCDACKVSFDFHSKFRRHCNSKKHQTLERKHRTPKQILPAHNYCNEGVSHGLDVSRGYVYNVHIISSQLANDMNEKEGYTHDRKGSGLSDSDSDSESTATCTESCLDDDPEEDNNWEGS